VLGLWVTVPFLAHGIDLLRHWRFTYVTNFGWRKDRMSTGYWNRNLHEHMLIGVRGKPPAPAMGAQFLSLLDGPVREHSEKPDWQYELVERYFPHLPKIELDARRARGGSDRWDDEAPAVDDPLGHTPELLPKSKADEIRREWRLFELFLVKTCGFYPVQANSHTEWVRGRPFHDVADWLRDDV
jgi:hypothetical protein